MTDPADLEQLAVRLEQSSSLALGGDVVVTPAFQDRSAGGKLLPTQNDCVDVLRVELDQSCPSSRTLCRDHRRA